MADINRSRELLLALPGAHRHQVEHSSIRTDRLVHLLGDLGLSAGAAQVAITRLTRSGIVRRSSHDGSPTVTLTEYAEEVLSGIEERVQEFGRTTDAGSGFTVVWNALPNTKRAARSKLAQSLRLYGFGQLQDSTWLALTDRSDAARSIIEHMGIGEFCSVMSGTAGASMNPSLLIARAWDLEGLTPRYRDFIERYAAALDDAKMTRQEAFVTRIRLFEDFKVFPTIDPEVGADLGGPVALRTEAVQLFHALFDRLRLPSERYFASVIREEAPGPTSS